MTGCSTGFGMFCVINVMPKPSTKSPGDKSMGYKLPFPLKAGCVLESENIDCLRG